MSLGEELATLARLFREGDLTEAEYVAAKERILGPGPVPEESRDRSTAVGSEAGESVVEDSQLSSESVSPVTPTAAAGDSSAASERGWYPDPLLGLPHLRFYNPAYGWTTRAHSPEAGNHQTEPVANCRPPSADQQQTPPDLRSGVKSDDGTSASMWTWAGAGNFSPRQFFTALGIGAVIIFIILMANRAEGGSSFSQSGVSGEITRCAHDAAIIKVKNQTNAPRAALITVAFYQNSGTQVGTGTDLITLGAARTANLSFSNGNFLSGECEIVDVDVWEP